MKNAILIGPMGSGKSTIGKLLASRFSLKFVDMDDAIVERVEKSIPEIFEEDGEAAFRALECEVLKALISNTEAKVIATGGGVVLAEANRELLMSCGHVIWLDAPPEMLAIRTSNDPNRPLLKGVDPLEKARELDLQRRPYYASCSDLRIDTSEMSVEEAVEAIDRFLSLYADE